MQISERFEGAGVREQEKLERLLLGPADLTHLETVKKSMDVWPSDLDLHELFPQLHVFKAAKNFSCLAEAAAEYQSMSEDSRMLLPQVKTLLKLLLLPPASTATAERSFSAMRRLKSWLRSSMGQTRLNAVALCHVHKDRLETVDIRALAGEFASRNDSRRMIFGKF